MKSEHDPGALLPIHWDVLDSYSFRECYNVTWEDVGKTMPIGWEM